MSVLRLAPVLLSCAVLLAACASPPTPRATDDPFAAVRERAQSDYQQGQQALARGDLEQALASFDQAAVNDPDRRQDIRAALDQTLQRIRAATPVVAVTPTRAPATAAADPTPPVGMAAYDDPSGRFRLAVPRDWRTVASPRAAFGTGVVAFASPDGTAELLVSADQSAEAISPELYAAKMELAMEKAPGYALQALVPETSAGGPAIRRTFTVRQQGTAGVEQVEAAFQLVLLRGSTPWVLEASAPADRFSTVAPTLDAMAASFRLR